TLITIECVDEIAAGMGLQAQVAAITERSMRGEIDFEQSLRARVALLKGLPVEELKQVYEHVLKLSPGAEWLLQQCQKYAVKFMLISGGFTYFTQRLQQQYGLDYTFANQLVIQDNVLNGELAGRIIDAQAKADLLVQFREKLGLNPMQVLAMGDGANDIPMLQAAGFGVAYHAKPKTQAATSINVRFGGLDAVLLKISKISLKPVICPI
ncbi:Phosphoserine phosphatase, partial [Snodgrassella alvi SCGC AB-598-J21]